MAELQIHQPNAMRLHEPTMIANSNFVLLSAELPLGADVGDKHPLRTLGELVAQCLRGRAAQHLNQEVEVSSVQPTCWAMSFRAG